MCSRGEKPSCIACWASEKLPEMRAWDAMIAAIVETTTTG